MKYLHYYENSNTLYNNNRPDAKYKVGDIIKTLKKNYYCIIINIYSKYVCKTTVMYECDVILNQENDNITGSDLYETEIRLATPEEITQLTLYKYNI